MQSHLFPTDPALDGTAVISSCERYRYRLTRPGHKGADKTTALFLMLNPSTADESIDDRTIGRCRSFARTWGCAGIIVANLYAYRATNPDDLWITEDPVGPENDIHIRALASEVTDVVCAWGTLARPDRALAVTTLLKASGARLWCLGVNKDGSPKHPLYVRGDQPLIRWLEDN